MFKVYISESAYKGIISSSTTGQAYLGKLLKQQPLQVLTPSDTEAYRAHPENMLKNPTALYILDIPAADALAIQRMYGVMCLSSSAPDITPLIDVNDEHTTEKRVPTGRGWDSVLDSVEHLPSNALILNDRYLFKTTNAVYGNGFDNIRSILTELLPRELNTKYHIAVIFDRNVTDPLYNFDSIAKRIYDIAQEFKKPYEIVTEVLGLSEGKDIYYKFHNRRIVSNYYVVKMDYSLAAFNKTEGTSEQTIIPQVLFTEESLNKRSSAPLQSMQQITKALQSFSESLKSPSMDHNSYSYAINGQQKNQCLTITNRLIK
jgi:hypothetical protein